MFLFRALALLCGWVAFYDGRILCCGGITLIMRNHERVAFAAFFSDYFIVPRLGEILARVSGVHLPWIFRLSLSFPFVKFSQVPSGPWVTLGGAVASGDHPLAYPRV